MLKRTICLLLSVCLMTGMLFSASFPVHAEDDTTTETTQPAETTSRPTESTTVTEESTAATEDDRPVIQKVSNKTRMSKEAIEILQEYEGFKTRPYWDVSQYSIGYGTKCPDDVYQYASKNKDYQITKEEATYLLLTHVNSKGAKLDDFIERNNLTLNQYQYDALILLTLLPRTSVIFMIILKRPKMYGKQKIKALK